MIKCKTLLQYKCLEFLKNNFLIEKLLIELNDESSIIITDCNKEKAIIYFDEKEKSVKLNKIDYWIVGELNGQYVCFSETDIDDVIEHNGYIVPREIKRFENAVQAYAYLKELINEGEYDYE